MFLLYHPGSLDVNGVLAVIDLQQGLAVCLAVNAQLSKGLARGRLEPLANGILLAVPSDAKEAELLAAGNLNLPAAHKGHDALAVVVGEGDWLHVGLLWGISNRKLDSLHLAGLTRQPLAKAGERPHGVIGVPAACRVHVRHRTRSHEVIDAIRCVAHALNGVTALLQGRKALLELGEHSVALLELCNVADVSLCHDGLDRLALDAGQGEVVCCHCHGDGAVGGQRHLPVGQGGEELPGNPLVVCAWRLGHGGDAVNGLLHLQDAVLQHDGRPRVRVIPPARVAVVRPVQLGADGVRLWRGCRRSHRLCARANGQVVELDPLVAN